MATLRDVFAVELEVVEYTQQSLGAGTNASAATYLECTDAQGRIVWGCGIDEDVATASVRAVLSAANSAVEAH